MPNIAIVNEEDLIFKALSDTTRRKILELLSQGDATVKQLASHFTHSLPSLMQHLSTLEESGLINTKKVGRVRTCSFKAHKLDIIDKWIGEQQKMWEGRMDNLDAFLQTKDDEYE